MPPKKQAAATLNLKAKKGGVFHKSSAESKGKAKVVEATPPPAWGLLGQQPSAASATTTTTTPALSSKVALAAEKAEAKLREFDLNGLYGPCINPTRLERWERAEALGLNPPKEVKDILLRYEGNFGPPPKKSGVSDKSLWFGRV